MIRACISLFAVFIALVLASELFVRLVLTLPVQTVPDPELGWVYKPYATVLHASEGRAVNQMNSMGFNDDDPDVDSGRIRILALGDSVTMALQVPRSENFTSDAEAIAPCLDVYNAGRSGLSPVHYPIVLSRIAGHFMPALAVVVITSGDMADMMNGNYEVVRDDTDKHIIDLRIKEKPMSRLRIMLDPLLSKSALATYLVYRLNALRVNGHNAGPAMEEAKPSGLDEEHVHQLLVYLLGSMNMKVPVAILYIQRLEYGTDRVSTADKRSGQFERLVRDAAHKAGILFVSTESYMKASYRKYGQPGVGFANNNILSGHLNGLGHRATAQALIDLVAQAGLQCPADKHGLATRAGP